MKYLNKDIARYSLMWLCVCFASILTSSASAADQKEKEDEGSFFSDLYITPQFEISPCYVGAKSTCYEISPKFLGKESALENEKEISRISFSGFNRRISLSYAPFGSVIRPVIAAGLARDRKLNDGNKHEPINGLGKIKTALVLGGGISIATFPYEIKALLYKDVTGNRKGLEGEIIAEADYTIVRDKLYMIPSVNLRFADKKYLNTEFGITEEQATNSAIGYSPTTDVYSTKAGFYSTGIAVETKYFFSEYVFLGLELQYDRLLNRVANSPIVAKYGNKNQLGASVSLNFKFWD